MKIQLSKEKIEDARIRKGWSIDDLAKQSGVSARTIYRTYPQTVMVSTAEQLAFALGVPLQDLAIDNYFRDPVLQLGVSHFFPFVTGQRRIEDYVASVDDPFKHLTSVLGTNYPYAYRSGRGFEKLLLPKNQEKNFKSRTGIVSRYPNTLRIALAKRRNVGTCMVLPINRNTAMKLENGEIDMLDICHSDLKERSKYLLLDHLFEHDASGVSEEEQQIAISAALVYQVATLGCDFGNPDFTVYAVCGLEEYAPRLERIGFVEVQTSMKTIDFPLYKFSRQNFLLWQKGDSEERAANLVRLTHSLASISEISSWGNMLFQRTKVSLLMAIVSRLARQSNAASICSSRAA